MPHSTPKRCVNDMPWLVSITPLGKPVVPDVYNSKATSSGAPSWPGSAWPAEPRQAWYSSPSVNTFCTPGNCLAASVSKCASPGDVTITLGCASATMACISNGANRQFKPVRMAPILLHANMSSKHSAQFFVSKATRSPTPTPPACKAFAVCELRSCNCANVQVSPSNVRAGADGRSWASWRSI